MREKKTCGGYSFKSFAEIGQEAEAWRKAYRVLRDEVRRLRSKHDEMIDGIQELYTYAGVSMNYDTAAAVDELLKKS
jgi:threonine synthase